MLNELQWIITRSVQLGSSTVQLENGSCSVRAVYATPVLRVCCWMWNRFSGGVLSVLWFSEHDDSLWEHAPRYEEVIGARWCLKYISLLVCVLFSKFMGTILFLSRNLDRNEIAWQFVYCLSHFGTLYRDKPACLLFIPNLGSFQTQPCIEIIHVN